MTPSEDALVRWLDAEVRAFVAATDSAMPDDAADLATTRRRYDRMCAAFATPHPEGVTTRDGAAGGVPIRRYRPARPAHAAVLLYAHGGGFVLGGLDSHDAICADLCAAAAIEVVAVGYRRAPEHRYPAALDDVAAAYRALAEGAPVVVAGDSAGGNLVAALCQRLRRLGTPQPAGQVLIYPLLAPDPLRVAGSRAADAPGLSAADCAGFLAQYGGATPPVADAEFAPLAAANFAGLAPAALFAAGYDPLHQDAEDYAAVLHAAGVPMRWRDDPGLVHGWLRGRHRMRLGQAAFAALAEAVADFGGQARQQ